MTEQTEPELYRHKKSGRVYKLLSKNSMHRTKFRWIETVVYTPLNPKDHEMDLYTREVDDFFESFEKIPTEVTE